MQAAIVGQDFRNVATGGTVSTITVGGKPYRLHAYTSVGSSTFTVGRGLLPFECFVVGGGGGGRRDNCNDPGGGAQITETSTSLPNGANTVIVGAGGGGGTGGATTTCETGITGGTSSVASVSATGGRGGGLAGINTAATVDDFSGTNYTYCGSAPANTAGTNYGQGGGFGSGSGGGGGAFWGSPGFQGVVYVRYEVLQ